MENNFKFYNTLTRQIDTVVPRVDGKIGMYTCGPTVYHFAHIGNIRSYIMEDVLEKALRYVGYDVKRVMNITDVGHLSSDGDTGEDKMLKGAKREHKSVMEVAKEYTDAFFKDFTAVHNRMPDVVEPATNCIPEFIHMVEVLIEKGYAYFAGGNVYFDTSKLDDYFVFSSAVEKEQLQVGVRDDVEEDVNKKNKNDFVLWFTQSKFEDQALKWDSPWGVGYPGWHIECSVMSKKYLADEIDIHAGGEDLIFPHHENEIAQSEAANGVPFAKYWMHNAFLNIDNKKMSKSLGNFFTVRDISREYDLEVLRFFMLSAHYRNPVNFSHDLMESAKNGLDRILTAVDNLRHLSENAKDVPMTEDEKKIIASIDDIYKKFEDSMDDDFNTADAISAIFELVKLANSNSSSDNSKEYIDTLMKKITTLTDILGLKTDKKEEMLDEDIEALIAERQQARKDKNFARADEIRDELLAKGIVLKDTREGVRWSRA